MLSSEFAVTTDRPQFQMTDRNADRSLRVVTYHRVEWPDEYPDLYPRLNSCDPGEFAKQLDFYQANYHIVSLHDVLSHVRGERLLPHRALLITFDDAYECVEKNVFPLVKSRNIPVTLFVPTAFPDCSQNVFWWDRVFYAIYKTEQRQIELNGRSYSLNSKTDRLRAFRLARAAIKSQSYQEATDQIEKICDSMGTEPCPSFVMGWSALRKLANNGIQLAPHSHTHPMLNRMTLDEAIQEVITSKQVLTEQIGDAVPCFAYPSGGVTAELANGVREAGFELAFSTARGINSMNHTDKMMLRRINVGARTSRFVLRAQLHSRFPFWALPGM